MSSILKVRDSATGEWINIPAIVGPQGDTGATGPAGKNGIDGITPHIGANGNWYIGETDTGMPSRGAEAPQESVLYTPQDLTPEQQTQARDNIGAVAVPETATVGQTIVVKAVDESGKPTEWETADLSSGGSAVAFPATPQFDVTVEEDVTVLLYNTLDGVSLSDYGFTKLYTIVQTTAQSEATSGEFLLCVNTVRSDASVNAPRASAGTGFMGQTAAKCWHAYYDLTAGTVQFSPGGSTNMAWSVAVNTVTDVSKLFGETIKNFKFVRTVGILAGTTIKVWLA